ncbi:molybdate ABC transporter substrate-binding protein [Moritella sp. F3]|uniref:molybdate ABC transporter substrate-binding protein n=1 Tax=Moritella sp. F3 TaxID=2718882 RepID=UPI0018E1661F|nr:molybdate ABC transporter substrate-binding protein [Moritella sp. F3]GIC75675.1 molybdate ABC transporter substrate-binding protein [Moritella sp. F1]GIC81877.1 molybdate ABC transporter substrate-binding protein [Moritella sp. F3]
MPPRYRHPFKHLTTILLFIFSSSVFAGERITVFAAASLTNALAEVGNAFKADNIVNPSKINPVFVFASSSTLARQIAQGAPAQIYLSANQKWMDYLVEKKAVLASSKVTLLRNALVLIAPNNSSVDHIVLNKHWNITQAVGDSRIAVGDPDHVPAGRYAKQALSNLDLWQQAMPLLARANNVRGALALVERGESPFGIVYATDAQIAKKVKVVAAFPSNSHKPIEYPLVLVEHTPSAATSTFYQYLQSDAAQAIFVKYGFKVDSV